MVCHERTNVGRQQASQLMCCEACCAKVLLLTTIILHNVKASHRGVWCEFNTFSEWRQPQFKISTHCVAEADHFESFCHDSRVVLLVKREAAPEMTHWYVPPCRKRHFPSWVLGLVFSCHSFCLCALPLCPFVNMNFDVSYICMVHLHL